MTVKQKIALGVAGLAVILGLVVGTSAHLQSGDTNSDTEENTNSATVTPPSPDAKSNPHSAVPTPNTQGNPVASAPVPNPAKLPSQILDLKNWRLTVPVDNDHSGAADQIDQPALASFRNDAYFTANGSNDAVLFSAQASGATTSGSSYPRSELREMTNNGRDKASWSDSVGRHTMSVSEAFMQLPPVKPEVVGAQIHDSKSDVVMIRLEGQHLFVQSSGKNIGDIDNNYVLGTRFVTKIEAEDGHIKVFYNGVQKVDFIKKSGDLYFKAGCYLQSNTTRGDAPQTQGQVAIYSLNVSHTN